MNPETRKLIKTIIEEIQFIKKGILKTPSIEEEKGNIKKWRKVKSEVIGFGPDVSDDELLELGEAMQILFDKKDYQIPALDDYEKGRAEETMARFADKVSRQINQPYIGLERAQARLTIARLLKSGLTLN